MSASLGLHDFVEKVQIHWIIAVMWEKGPVACVDPQLEHSEICSTVEATRGHYACVKAALGGLTYADPAITTEPRALTPSTSRPAALFIYHRCCPRTRHGPRCTGHPPTKEQLLVKPLKQLFETHNTPPPRNPGTAPARCTGMESRRPTPASRHQNHARCCRHCNLPRVHRSHQHRWTHEVQIATTRTGFGVKQERVRSRSLER